MRQFILGTRTVLVWAMLLVVPSEWAKSDSPVNSQTDSELTRELIDDAQFTRGLILWDPAPGRHVEYARISGVAENQQPVWGLAQWSSREKLRVQTPQRLASGALRYANVAKAVTLGHPGTADADIALAVNSQVEYAGHVRESGEPWVHLLVEQQFDHPPTLDLLTSARFHLAARLKSAVRHEQPGYTPTLHAAQSQLFFTLANCNENSAGYGQLLWFGVPLYDDRQRMTAAYKAKDVGKDDASNMFIYTVAAEELTNQSLHDQDWVTIEKDLLPMMLQGLQAAWQAGFLKDSKSLEDYCVSGMNLGWEVPGAFDVEMQYRDLSLQVTTRTTEK